MTRNRKMGVGGFLVGVLLVAAVWLAATPAHASTHFDMGFRVTTARPTNVVVRYKVRCSNAEHSVYRAERFEAVTPFTSSVTQTLANATSCHLRVVAWDVPPWAGPHGNGAVPTVTSWINP